MSVSIRVNNVLATRELETNFLVLRLLVHRDVYHPEVGLRVVTHAYHSQA